jgi:hypothetical protein
MIDAIHIRFSRDYYVTENDKLAVRIGYYDREGCHCLIEEKDRLKFVNVEEGCVRPITRIMDISKAKEIMDNLWNCGIRPSDQGSPGQLRATEKHLNDMRKIAFKKLNMGEI